MRNFIKELFSYIGFASAFYGIYQMHMPSAFIVGGVFLLWITTAAAKGEQK